MNFFNFWKETKPETNHLTEFTHLTEDDKKSLKAIRLTKLRYPKLEEVIKAIIGEFTEEQLKKLEFVSDNGKTISFERHLYLEYKGYYAQAPLKEIIEEIRRFIDENLYIFDLPNQNSMFVLFKDVFNSFLNQDF